MKLFQYTTDKTLIKLFRILLGLLVVAMLLVILSLHSKIHFFEIMVSFYPQIMIVLSGVGLLLVSILARFVIRDGLRLTKHSIRKKEASTMVLLLGLSMYAVVTGLFGSIQPLQAENEFGTQVRVATYNELYSNTSGFAIQSLSNRSLDVLVLQEVRNEDIAGIQQILGMEFAVSSNCGCSAADSDVHILSKHPISQHEVIGAHQNGAIVRATIAHPIVGLFSVYGTHMTAPFTTSHYEKRGDMYVALQEHVLNEKLPVFVLGDFNTTVYSPALREFESAIEDTSKLVLNKNWPKCSRYEVRVPLDLACVRIDHIFIPKNATFISSTLIENTRSDHLPVLATVVFPEL